MRAETVDCVMFILRAASMKLPGLGNHQERARES